MTSSSKGLQPSSASFFDLLLEQFKGSDGELPTAIAYLTQATNEDNPGRKASLIRIARAKLRNADIVASILLQISKGESSQLLTRVNRREFETFLACNGVNAEQYAQGHHWLKDMANSEVLRETQKNRFNTDPTKYLQANISTEEKQIFIYKQLVEMTRDRNFISALNYVQARQIQHRDDLVELLRRLTR
jgi:Mn-containing catalase